MALRMMEYLVNITDDKLTNNSEDPYVFFTLTDSEGNELS